MESDESDLLIVVPDQARESDTGINGSLKKLRVLRKKKDNTKETMEILKRYPDSDDSNDKSPSRINQCLQTNRSSPSSRASKILQSKIDDIQKSKVTQSKKQKKQTKIKVKNKFFKDMEFEVKEKKQQGSITEQLVLGLDPGNQERQRQTSLKSTIKKQRIQKNGILHKIESRAELLSNQRNLKNLPEDYKCRRYLKNKLQQIDAEVQELTIGVQMPSIFRSKSASAALLLQQRNCKNFESKNQTSQTEATQRKSQNTMEKARSDAKHESKQKEEAKLLRQRGYFYRKLQENISIQNSRESKNSIQKNNYCELKRNF